MSPGESDCQNSSTFVLSTLVAAITTLVASPNDVVGLLVELTK